MARRKRSNQVLRCINIAAREPVHLAVAGAAVFTAPLLAAWWPLAAGFTAYLLLIFLKIRSPTFLRNALAAEEAAYLTLPDETRLTTPALRTAVASVKAGHTAIRRSLEHVPEEVRAHAQRALCGLDELERAAADLARRAEAMAQFLGSCRRENLQLETIRLGEQLHRCSDAEAQNEYRSALIARQEQLSLVEDVERRHERIMARLQRIVAIIDGLPARIMHLQLVDSSDAEPHAELDSLLEQMSGEFCASEQLMTAIGVFEPESVAAQFPACKQPIGADVRQAIPIS